MVFLADPTPRGERAYSNVWCGQAAAASVATDWLQRPVFPPEIDALIPDSMRIRGGTTDLALSTALRALGIPVHVFGWPMDTYLRLLPRGRQGIGLHQCNGWAQPVKKDSSGIAHWRRFYGLDQSSVATMNPWTNQNERTDRNQMFSSDLGVFILVDGEFPKDRPAPKPAPPTNTEDGQVYAVGPGTRLAVTRCTDLDADNSSPLDYSLDMGLTWQRVPGMGRTRHQVQAVTYDGNTNKFVVWVVAVDGVLCIQQYNAATAQWEGQWTRTTGSTL